MSTISSIKQLLVVSVNRFIANSQTRSFHLHRSHVRYQSARMSSVYVRNFEDDERLQISLDLKIPNENGKTRFEKFNLNRLKNEELRLSVERLRLNVTKKLVKKSKKRKVDKTASTSGGSKLAAELDSTESDVPIEIIHNGAVLDMSVSNQSAWVEGAVLKVWEEEISICYNPPTVKLENLPKTMMVDFPLFPEAEYKFTDAQKCEFYWKVYDEKHMHKLLMEFENEMLDLNGAVKSLSYTPQAADIGRHILLACIPRNGDKTGKMDVTFSSGTVTEGPGPCPFEKRHEFTKDISANGEFRVVCYNLLAHVYSDTELAKEQLFSHCPTHALEMDYRRHLLLKEILGYQADLLCLQEVDKSMFVSHLLQPMQVLGYTGFFLSKDGQKSEGCASFVRDCKFRVINQLDIGLSSFLVTDPLCADIWSKVSSVKPLKEKLEQRPTVLQVTVAESLESPGHFVCLANTHLYFYPSACNVRLIQAAVALRYLENVCDTYKQEGKKISLVFCGDFNSAPHLGVYQLMTAQFIPSDHADWSSAGDKELVNSLELHQSFNIESACGTPAYTNFTKGFQATLDYIFIDSDKLEVSKVVPLPSHEDVVANIALPNVVFPSDHLALVCDIKFKL